MNISTNGDYTALNVNANEIQPIMAAYGAATFARPRIENSGQIRSVLGQYGTLEFDTELRHEVVKFASLAQMNAARIALTGDTTRAVPEDCANGTEFYAAIRGGILGWMILDIPVHEGLCRIFMDVMYADDLAERG